MDAMHNLVLGFQVALTPTNLLYCFVGCFMGTLIGVLPGIGPAAGIAILIPITSGLDTTTALIMLAGIYYGAMYGGSTTAILINLPGEAGSVATVLDGYQMARKGRAGPALGISAISSFIAGTLSVIGLMLLAPPLASVALAFGPPEVFFVMLLGMTIVMSVAGESMLKGLMAGLFGLFLATVGLDSQTGATRFTFGSWSMAAGFDVISVVVGLFGIAEILSSGVRSEASIFKTKLGSLLPTRQEMKAMIPTFGRCTIIGFLVGLLPGGNSAIASFMAYDVEKKVSKHPERFGHGAIEGVCAPEGANNAVTGGSMVPMLTLGVPVSAAMAILMGAMMMHGLRPGPLLFEQNPRFVWGLIASMYVGNIMLLVLNLPLVGFWASMLKIPYRILAPIVLVFCFIGAYTIRDNMFDVWVAVAFGFIGYAMQRGRYPVAPVVLGLILAPMMEDALRQSLSISRGDPSIFFTRPIAAGLLILCILSVIGAVAMRRRQSKAVQVLVGGAQDEK
jgi:putative tricarboxylic transport membrane protein